MKDRSANQAPNSPDIEATSSRLLAQMLRLLVGLVLQWIKP